MRVVVQRVKEAKVTVDGDVTGQIEKGLLVFFAVHHDDQPEQAPWLVNKLVTLRIFEDDQGKMNRNVQEIGGEILVVSQFTLYGNCRNGRRPDFIDSAPPEKAKAIYDTFTSQVREAMGHVQEGVFAAYMDVCLINDGPVTFIIDGK